MRKLQDPRLFADSAQGAEWDVVLLDLTTSNADRVQDLGHMYDDHRACVALTRARQVLLSISGSLQGNLRTQIVMTTKSGIPRLNPRPTKLYVLSWLVYGSFLGGFDPAMYKGKIAIDKPSPDVLKV